LTLERGTRLGPYEIVAPLGAGGMGEVYRATDTRLARTVAIKILPPHLSRNAELRNRFEREARAISSLNHANICTLYDVGEATPFPAGEAVSYLVMEYLEGESLASRIARGPLPLAQVKRIGVEIAEALAKAHRQGIVHRDLKPGNVMLTRSGVKLLDFGLAKILDKPDERPVLSPDAPTKQTLTATGTILGTLQYMSPEQLEGDVADARSDIFALGATLCEMTTGQRPFSGTSQASLIASILREDPVSLRSLRKDTPAMLERTIAICLAKDPDERWQTAHDVALHLRLMETSEDNTPATTFGRRPAIPLLAAVALAAAGIAALGMWMLLPRFDASPRKRLLSIILPLPLPRAPHVGTNGFDISADGARLVYIGNDGRRQRLYLRLLESSEVKAIEGTDDASMPFFSPDGNSIGFFAKGRIRRVSLDGSSSAILAEAPFPVGGSWGDDGIIVFAPSPASGIMSVPARGGAARTLVEPDTGKGEAAFNSPETLPGGKVILFTAEKEGKGWDQAAILAWNTEKREKKLIIDGATSPKYLPSGQLLFHRAGRVMSVALDLQSLQTRGEPQPLVDRVVAHPGTGVGFYDASRDGTIVYLEGSSAFFDLQPVWYDRSGNRRPFALPARPYIHPRLSPDEQRIAFEVMGANDDIWIYHEARGTLSRLTTASENLYPEWSPDGTKLVVSKFDAGGVPNLFVHYLDGSRQDELLVRSSRAQFPTSWAGSGRIAFSEETEENEQDIYLLDRASGSRPIPFLVTSFNEGFAAISPDGVWIAYVSDESGQTEVYARRGSGGDKIQISLAGGTDPVWAKDGREIFFRDGKTLYAVQVSKAAANPFGAPRALFQAAFENGQTSPNYDVSRDGKRFLVVERSERADDIVRLNVLLGATTERH